MAPCIPVSYTHLDVYKRQVYKLRPDLNAVLHAHPPALVAFSVVRRLPELNLTPTVRYM